MAAGNDAPCVTDAARNASAAAVLDHHAIAALLPQQGPFLLVDRVITLVEGQRIVGLKNVSLTEPYFRGHFPGNPIMPGVLICEALAQVAAILVQRSFSIGSSLVLVGLDGVRFRRPVVPGEQLQLEVAFSETRGRRWRLQGVARVGEQVAAAATIVLSPRDEAER